MMDPQALRIIDANLNRAGEGLRVLEEHARLVLEDPGLTSKAKGLRHALAQAGRVFRSDEALAARDIVGDVGTSISTATESRRADTAEVAAAAARRVAESLRCIEEYGKLIDPESAARVERLRYVLYGLEQELFVTGPRRSNLAGARLHVLVTEAYCAGDWMEVAESAIAGGAEVIQLREKSLSDGELLERVKRLREPTKRRGALLIINDRPDIARLAGADGVHVGQQDLPVAEARRIAGPTVLVGKSVHSVAQARSAIAERPDYLAVGPMFASRTKPDVAVAGPRLLAEVGEMCELPVVAIGGITAENVGQLKSRRPFAVAACQAVVSAADPAAAAAAIKAAFSGCAPTGASSPMSVGGATT